jgi:hypothetical protein
MSKARAWMAAQAAWICLLGCSSQDPALYDSGGAPLAASEPVAYRLAVAPVEIDPAVAQEGDLAKLGCTEDEVRAELVRALLDLRAASEIFPVSSPSAYSAYMEKADLLLVPRIEKATFRHKGNSGGALTATLLWVTTWVGSLWVEDSTYRAQLGLKCQLVDPHTGVNLASDVEARSDEVDLSFWDRNEAFSGNFFSTMIMPPFLTKDDQAQTSHALLRRSMEVVAAKLKVFLREGLPNRELGHLAHVLILEPKNDAVIEGPAGVRCEIVARRPITEALVLVNGDVLRRLGDADLPSPKDQMEGEYYKCRLNVEGIEVTKPGANLIRVLINVAGQWASRSILVQKKPAPGEVPVQG